MPGRYFVYILTNLHNKVLYVGVTNDLARRLQEHKDGVGCDFASKYNVNRLVYFEEWPDIRDAISREKQIKKGSRQKKIDLVNSLNPQWKDLAQEIPF